MRIRPPKTGYGLTALLIALPGLFFGLHRLDAPPPVVAAASVFPVGSETPAPGGDRFARDPREGDRPKRRFVTSTLGPGGTLGATLDELGIHPAERHGLVLSIGAELDLSRLPQSTGVSAAVDDQGTVQSVAVRSEPGRFVRWSRRGGQPLLEVVPVPVRVAVEHRDGRIRHSVRQALDGSTWADELTAAFADIFQWDIDLLVEPRAGDVVSLVYEVEILDGIPADLPPFGQSARSDGEPLRPGRVLAAAYRGRIAEGTAFWVEPPGGFGNYFDGDGAPLRKTFLKSPLNYRRISSRFSSSRRHPITRAVVPHHGIDFAAPAGTPVVAAADGRVAAAGWDGALGRAIRVRHGSEYVTVYGHLNRFARGIRVGTEVSQNQVIGYVGSTGRATGPHLHYTLIHRGRPIDPMGFRNPPADPLPAHLTPSLERAKRAWAPLLEPGAVALAGTDPSGSAAGPRRGI